MSIFSDIRSLNNNITKKNKSIFVLLSNLSIMNLPLFSKYIL